MDKSIQSDQEKYPKYMYYLLGIIGVFFIVSIFGAISFYRSSSNLKTEDSTFAITNSLQD